MNSRVRNRLIGISAVLSIVAVAGLVFFFFNGTSLSMSVDRLYNSPQEYVGETIRIRGTVVSGSWDRETNPMTFRIFDDASDSEAEVTIVYEGLPPANFGDGTIAIIDGRVEGENLVVSHHMTTVCPSRYETSDDALPVADLFDRYTNMVGIPVRVSARVVDGSITPPGTEIRFTVHDIVDESIEMPIIYSGGLADSIVDGTPVVLTGQLNEDGAFEAEIVAHIADS